MDKDMALLATATADKFHTAVVKRSLETSDTEEIRYGASINHDHGETSETGLDVGEVLVCSSGK